MRIELSKRLQAVAEMVTPGMRLADVGTDHGYIPIYLTEQGVIPSAIAMDINRGPLAKAREHIEEMGLANQIETRLSDGLQNVSAEEVDTMITAGMGGGLVIHILSAEEKTAKGLKELILQPQSEISKVRSYLNENGYRIIAENMVYEDGKYYPMMKAVVGESEIYTEEELEYGKHLLAERHPVLQQYLQWEIKHHKEIIDTLKKQDSDKAKERILQLEEKIDRIEQILKERYIDEV